MEDRTPSPLPAPQEAQARALDAMTRARAALVMEQPFFATLALRLHLTPDPGCRDIWTDGKVLAFNPLFAAGLPDAKLVGAQAHAVMHLACGHHVRRKGRDEALWNRACDYVVNQILLDAGFSLPQGFTYDPDYAGCSVDAIYAALYKLQEREANNGAENAMDTGPGGGDGASGAQRFEGGEETAPEQAKSVRAGDDKGEGGQDAGKAQGARAQASGEEKGKKEEQRPIEFVGEVRDHPLLDGSGASPAQKTAERESDIAVSQALQRALHWGDIPAGFSRLLRKAVRPSLDWRGLLRRFLEQHAFGDYAWTSPNRRYLHQDIYLPSRREPHIPGLALAVDSSGSVDEAALAAFCAELASVLEAYDSTLTVIFHDAAVQSVMTLTRQDMPLALTPLGGGGTDYRPVGAYLEEHDIRPACLIWFTDLECDSFPEEPPCPVLWVCGAASGREVPFGDVLHLPAGPGGL